MSKKPTKAERLEELNLKIADLEEVIRECKLSCAVNEAVSTKLRTVGNNIINSTSSKVYNKTNIADHVASAEDSYRYYSALVVREQARLIKLLKERGNI